MSRIRTPALEVRGAAGILIVSGFNSPGSARSSGGGVGLLYQLENSMRTHKIIGWILGIFFIFCGAGAITDAAWFAAFLFAIAGFIAIPLPNKQLQALRITPWPGLALSFVVAGIAMWLAVSGSPPPLPIEKADKNFKVYDAGHSKGIPLFAKRNVGDLTIFSDAKTYEERIHTVLYAAKRYLEQEDLKYVRVFHLSYPHEALIGTGAVIAIGEYAPDGKGGDGSGPLAHKTWQASAVKGEVDEVAALIEVLWNQMRDRYQVTDGSVTYTDEPALKQAISEAIKGSIPPDKISLPTYRLVDYEQSVAMTGAPAEEIKSTRPARALEEEAGNKINNATAQIERAEPAKELDLPEISNAEPEANTFSDAEIAAAMAAILRDARAEKTVLAASWETYPTGARILVAEAVDDGTKRDGFADYLCIGIRSKNIPRASVTIVRDLSRGPFDIDNILGVQSCF